MRYETAAQTIAAGGTLTLGTTLINSTGDITASGTTGLTLTAGQYLVQFSADASIADEGELGIVLALDGAALPYTANSLESDADDEARLVSNAILNLTASQTLTAENNTANAVIYDNAVLTVVKLA